MTIRYSQEAPVLLGWRGLKQLTDRGLVDQVDEAPVLLGWRRLKQK